MIQMIIGWTDTLMLGYFQTSARVGLYSAALPLAHLIGIPLAALLPIYGPITAGLYAKNSVAEMGRNYAIVTKWIFSATLPLFLLLFLFPETVLNFLFGVNYMLASHALRILSLGFIIVNLLGPNGTTLVAIGKTKFLMWAIVVAAGTNIALNAALIPQWGIAGAATATTASLTLHCIIRQVKVHAILGITPLTKNLLKTVISSISIIFIIYLMVEHFVTVTFWILPILFFLFYAVYFMVILFSRSFDQEDIMLLLEIEKKMGINMAPIKKILSRFL
jgi:O-antigen/teichoic acid export membrane protein